MRLFVIVNARGKGKVYFVKIEKSKKAIWTTGPYGEIRKKRGNENQTTFEESVAVYTEDVQKAATFETREAAESVIAENSILQFCQVVKIDG
jgi:hypothetical protein